MQHFPTKKSAKAHVSFAQKPSAPAPSQITPQQFFSPPSSTPSPSFLNLGFVGIRKFAPVDVVKELNSAADRPNSRARMAAEIISGGALQITMDDFSPAEVALADELCSVILASPPLHFAAKMLWGADAANDLQIVSRTILEGGGEQMPHADSLYPTALVALISMRDGQASTNFHVDARTNLTAFSNELDAAADGAEGRALDAISIVSKPEELMLRPGLDSPMNCGDGMLMAASVVHAGPGGVASDGSPRRVAFISIAPRALLDDDDALRSYNPRGQYHVVQYLFSREMLEQRQKRADGTARAKTKDGRAAAGPRPRSALYEAVFERLQAQQEAWHRRGHDLLRFLVPSVRKEYDEWLDERMKRVQSSRRRR